MDFQLISFGNLSQLGCFAASLGPNGSDLQRQVAEAMQAHKHRSAVETPCNAFRPKRSCLTNWSPDLGANSADSVRKVCSTPLYDIRWHEGAIYGRARGRKQILCWKPGDDEPRAVAGEGARVAGVNDFGPYRFALMPHGKIVVADVLAERLIIIQNGVGDLLLSDVTDLRTVFCSPNGVVYVLSHYGRAVHKRWLPRRFKSSLRARTFLKSCSSTGEW